MRKQPDDAAHLGRHPVPAEQVVWCEATKHCSTPPRYLPQLSRQQPALQALNKAGQTELPLRVSHDAQCTLLCALIKGRLQGFRHVCTPLECKDERSDTVDALVC